MDQKQQNVSSSSNSTIQHKLQSIIQNQRNNWAYAIFWNLTTPHHYPLQPLLTWGAAHFQSHRHLQPSTTARDFPAPDGVVLTNAIRSNEVVWLNNRRRKQPQSYGIRTLVCIPTPNGVIELGSSDVIPQDSRLVEQANAEFNNSTDIKYAEALQRQEELINHRFSSLRSYINELQMRVEELESQVPRELASEETEETEASSREEGRVVEVEVKMVNGELDQAVIRVESRNLSYAGARLMDALRDLELKVLHGSITNLKDLVTVQDVVVEVPTGSRFNHEAIKQALVTMLHH